MGNAHGHHPSGGDPNRRRSRETSHLAHRPSTGSGTPGVGVRIPIFEDGPVDITARVNNEGSGSSSAGSGGISRPHVHQPHRPRATTEIGRAQRQKSVDIPSALSATNGGSLYPGDEEDILSRKDKEAEIEAEIKKNASGRKRLPTIFKYNSKEAKEVYVCGKRQ